MPPNAAPTARPAIAPVLSLGEAGSIVAGAVCDGIAVLEELGLGDCIVEPAANLETGFKSVVRAKASFVVHLQ